jgi:hypothetical protein
VGKGFTQRANGFAEVAKGWTEGTPSCGQGTSGFQEGTPGFAGQANMGRCIGSKNFENVTCAAEAGQ